MKLAIIDDHRLFRDGLRALLEREPDLEIAGEAADAREAYVLVDQVKPEVAIMDINLPGVNGVTATREIKRRFESCKILILSMHAGEEFVSQALSAGASGYALKEQASYEIVDAIRAVGRGRSYLSPGISKLVVEDFLRLQRGQSSANGPRDLLSERERVVFDLLVRGYSNQPIAAELGISVKTVETHRAHVLKKLQVHSIVDLVRLAARHGLLPD